MDDPAWIARLARLCYLRTVEPMLVPVGAAPHSHRFVYQSADVQAWRNWREIYEATESGIRTLPR